MNRTGPTPDTGSPAPRSSHAWLWLGLALVVVVVLGTVVARAFYGERPARVHELAGATMGTTWTLRVSLPVGAPEEWVGAMGDTVQARLDRIERLMSTWDSTSELSRFNRTDGTGPVELSAETLAVLEVAAEVGESSAGAFDITVAPLVDAWGFGPVPTEGRIPSSETLDALRSLVGLDRIRIDAAAGTAAKTDPRVVVDLSGVAKGYGLDLAAEGAERMGAKDFALEVGGEVSARGGRPDGTAWRVAIEAPTPGARAVFRVLELRDQTVATSGDYRNFVEIDGTRYSHLVDPRTGFPIPWRGFSVSVLHPRAAYADAWATALSVLGPDEGLALAEKLGLSVAFVVPGETGRFEVRYTGEVGDLLQL